MAIPQEKPYVISVSLKAQLKAIMETRKSHPVNILIRGKHGTGKSFLATQLAAKYKMDYVPVPISLLQESGQLMGHDEFRNNQTEFIASDFVKACRTPNTLIHLEELNRPESPKALGELFPLLDDTRAIQHNKLGRVEVANGNVFIGTLNEGFEYSGIDPLDEALRDRFFQIELSYLPESQEVMLITMRTGMKPQDALSIVKFINSLRNDSKEPIHVSTRRSIMASELIMAGLPMQQALISSIALDKDKLESILLRFEFSGKGLSSGFNGSTNVIPKIDAFELL